MIRPHRSHPLWFAYALHRASGLGLALCLAVHFYVLSKAITQPEKVDAVFLFAENPLVKLVEFGLVFGLAVHIFGGLRLMAMEWLPWSDKQKTLAACAVAGAFFVSGTFLLQAV